MIDFFSVIGDVASIYRPSVIFWTSSLVTPGFGLEMARPWLDFLTKDHLAILRIKRTDLQNKKLKER